MYIRVGQRIRTKERTNSYEKNELTIRSNAAEFLIFEEQSHAHGVEVIYQDATLWMSQRMMRLLFDVESV